MEISATYVEIILDGIQYISGWNTFKNRIVKGSRNYEKSRIFSIFDDDGSGQI